MRELRRLTPARVALGRAGVSLPTQALLDFTLSHARARDAVHAAFDRDGIVAGLAALGLTALPVQSRAGDRKEYLARPDHGRQLDPASLAALSGAAGGDLALMIGDGLSPVAVNLHALELVRRLLPRLASSNISVGAAAVATGARVALGDEVGATLNARAILVLIGERPGLSAPHSLGAYLTFAPRPGRSDAERNCVSNIHAAGIGYDEAAHKLSWLIGAALTRQLTGVALKDESGIPDGAAALPGP